MPDFSWLEQEEDLSPAALTVRAQTISPNDDGMLLWDAFFPRADTDSVDLREITTTDFRPVSDRREWNQRGRLVPLITPDRRDLSMVPIEAYFTVEEKEIQKLTERALGANVDIFREIIGARIPARSDGLVVANFRRIEIEAFEAWALGQITAMDPQTGDTGVTDFGFDSARYETASTDWDDGSVNAYDEFIAFMEDAVDLIGPVRGAVMRLATLKAIQDDAPTGDGPRLTRDQLRDRVAQELGTAFEFFVIETSLDPFDDGGIARTRTKVWPAEQVAAVPDGTEVGNTHFAPVARAAELAREAPGAGIDVRGQTVYHEGANAGRELTVEAQVNAVTVPDEQRVAVIDVGV